LGKPFVVAIPSYSEVLFLRQWRCWWQCICQGRNPFLFRGPIPTLRDYFNFLMAGDSRNPFLFRGPIPTIKSIVIMIMIFQVAIPSYSEVLFLRFG